ncbi:MAG: MBL fold metallo-hydrolase [Nitriliruptorales bacterium]|nr:MBL fold metallo-hydrolase [Nitriliruptorales bacterium]
MLSAPKRQRNPDNVEGPWFVDDACIDCDAVRQLAPSLISRVDGKSVVVRQPANDDDERAMWLAALACPTNSLRTDPPRPRPRGLYPLELGDDVWYCGHNARSSFGANAYLVERRWGRAMIDAPRWHPDIVSWLEARGGLDHVLFTHRDDVADGERYAEHFGARVWIHADDRSAAPGATNIIEDEATIEEGLVTVPVPGHTKGSVVFLLDDDALFTGDSLYWSRRRRDVGVFTGATWYSLEAQLDSLEHLARRHRFAWLLPGHGQRHRTSAEDMPTRVLAMVDAMRNG